MMTQAIMGLLIVKKSAAHFRVARSPSTGNSKSSNHSSGVELQTRRNWNSSVVMSTPSLALPFLPTVHPPLSRFLIVCSAVGPPIDSFAEHLSLPWCYDRFFDWLGRSHLPWSSNRPPNSRNSGNPI
jgi:hypothetical protein